MQIIKCDHCPWASRGNPPRSGKCPECGYRKFIAGTDIQLDTYLNNRRKERLEFEASIGIPDRPTKRKPWIKPACPDCVQPEKDELIKYMANLFKNIAGNTSAWKDDIKPQVDALFGEDSY